MERLIFEYSRAGRRAHTLPDAPSVDFGWPERQALRLPEVSEIDVVRHYTRLSRQNYGVDNGFYPLGSCTMKYNPKVNEKFAEKFAGRNPQEADSANQDLLSKLYATERMLCQVFGYARFTLQPAAGAHGEFTGLLIIRAYHRDRGDARRTKILVPDAAHGTNPASCTLAGFQQVSIKSLQGGVDIADLKKHLDDTVAGLMLTNPNTLGLFEKNILQIADLVHTAGGLLYYDGANANATMGIAKPAAMGFDVCHINLHKTFSTPHGGGGPGAGPVGVSAALVPYLPCPVLDFAPEDGGHYYFNYALPKSIGQVHSFYGNVGVLLKAYAYLRIQGSAGLKKASALAVLNANYLKARLQKVYDIPYPRYCQHEFVISVQNFKKQYGVTAADIAKRLMDYGYHPPTVYFPLIVPECLMLEPTETEAKEELDAFCDALLQIAEEVRTNPALVKSAPHSTIIGRPDEVRAVKEPDLNYFNSLGVFSAYTR
ncbi:glycine dehydrogenase subunit 2 [Candidatus Termititenax persephonae]|uniref:glycine dehydrogenase (aminomethyl-transferring) n=1 Tax=Candidatus Termititenax persephonae TaxID=2218525 RepID=A0A388TGI5_9BACT|nr:glycine dehydrogenase subunit 2 [Candidatus Termititenax persephonae]